MKVEIGVSARHVHLKQEDLDILFGKDYKLRKKVDLSQTGQYACEETVNIKTDAGEINNVRILGPVREYTQVEISKADSYELEVNPPVRRSGNLDNAAIVTIAGPSGEVTLPCAIIAIRHIHITPEKRAELGLTEDKISIRKDGEKGGILSNIMISENESYTFECHIDLDDANAFNIKDGEELEIV